MGYMLYTYHHYIINYVHVSKGPKKVDEIGDRIGDKISNEIGNSIGDEIG